MIAQTQTLNKSLTGKNFFSFNGSGSNKVNGKFFGKLEPASTNGKRIGPKSQEERIRSMLEPYGLQNDGNMIRFCKKCTSIAVKMYERKNFRLDNLLYRPNFMGEDFDRSILPAMLRMLHDSGLMENSDAHQFCFSCLEKTSVSELHSMAEALPILLKTSQENFGEDAFKILRILVGIKSVAPSDDVRGKKYQYWKYFPQAFASCSEGFIRNPNLLIGGRLESMGFEPIPRVVGGWEKKCFDSNNKPFTIKLLPVWPRKMRYYIDGEEVPKERVAMAKEDSAMLKRITACNNHGEKGSYLVGQKIFTDQVGKLKEHLYYHLSDKNTQMR